MLGWGVSVFRKGDENSQSRKNLVLARWETGVWGLNWLDKLVKENKAIDLGGNGYPNRYSIKAGVLLPILKAGLPEYKSPPVIGDDYILPKGWNSDLLLNEKEFFACRPDEILIIEAWDLS